MYTIQQWPLTVNTLVADLNQVRHFLTARLLRGFRRFLES
jgi:hypothetical protein